MDINEIIFWVGRAHTQDDTFTALSHNSLLHDWNSEFDNGRIGKPASISQLKNARAYDDLLGVSYWGRVRDAIKILHHINQVKLIVVDLDDTHWRGIAGEVAALESGR